MRFLRTRREVAEGYVLPPWYYGYAYREWWRQVDVFYPIPLNLVVAATWWVRWRWAKLRSTESPLDRAFWKRLTSEGGRHYQLGRSYGRSEMLQELHRLELIATPLAMVLTDLENRGALIHCRSRDPINKALEEQFSTPYPQPGDPTNGDQDST